MDNFKKSIVIKASGIFFVLVGVFASLIGKGDFDDGVRSLLFFTLQSNIAMGILLAVFLIDDIRVHHNKRSFIHRPLLVSKYAGTTSVLLTFLVFGLLLAPVLPITYTFSVTSISLHFFAPLLALADFLLFGHGKTIAKKDVWWALVLPSYYVAFVFICIAIGITFPPDATLVPYFFLDYATFGWFSFKNGGIGVAYWFMIISALVLAIAFITRRLGLREKR